MQHSFNEASRRRLVVTAPRHVRWAASLAALTSLVCLSCSEVADTDALQPSESPSDPYEADELASTEQAVVSAPPCTTSEVNNLTANATSAIDVTCSAALGGRAIHRPLRFHGNRADGVTLDCQGGTIGQLNDGEFTSTVTKRMISVYTDFPGDQLVKDWAAMYQCERPESVTIKNCIIYGTVRIWGLGENGQAPLVKQSSIDPAFPGHSARARAAAPIDVTLDNVVIHGEGGNPLYIAPGVTRFTLVNSTLEGTSTSVGMYLDAESRSNVIRKNHFTVDTDNREIIAIDGSSDNLIVDNRLYHLENGGMFLYRNCGEGGAVRWSTPSENRIINNFFYYNVYDGSNPAIYVGSRDGSSPGGYCDEDDAYPFGSGATDYDYARYNTIMQNQFRKRSVSESIEVNSPSINSPNYIGLNETVDERIVREAGCRLPTGNFVPDNAQGVDGCAQYQCNDGVASIVDLCQFSYSYSGPIAGKQCVQLSEPADPNGWDNNYLCWNQGLALRWSSAGPIPGLFCTAFNESADPHTWNDNYLCNSWPLGLIFSSAGPVANKRCLAITEPADPHTWNDNYLCWPAI